MIVYFSGTGNSRYCAQRIAASLDDEIVDAFSFIRDGIRAELFSNQPWVFVSPTYGWQLPHIFADFIRNSFLQGSHNAYFVMTCGSEIGNASTEIEKLCKEINLKYQGVLEVVMPENYIAMFRVPEREEAKQIIKSAQPVLEAGIACVRKGIPFPMTKISPLDRMKSGPVNHIFYHYFIKAKPFYATNACVSCGKCVSSCVLSNIVLKDGKPIWGSQCTHCMACICGCPQQAIEYGRASRGKPRYQCKDYVHMDDAL